MSFILCVPNMIVAAPTDENECRLLLSTCYQADAPVSVRYPRGTGTGAPVSDGMETVEIGMGIIRLEGEKSAFIAFGSMFATALAVAEKLNATVADMRFVKPIDEELIVRLARSHDRIVT
ncbi:1-deoxy-D-xylulose-5-phosphate synthase, partial [Peribacillus butanolivorans]|nr:1-deoxy-D-xylulose-5-phosphate synthase [Peribacillus butanolivorans]